MADVGIDMLEAIETRLATYTATGQTLAAIKSYWVKYTEYDMPPDFGTAFPAIMVDMMPMSGQVASIPACMTRKSYPVRFQIFTEQAGNTADPTAAELMDLIEDVFYQYDLGISTLFCKTVEKNYSLPVEIPFAARLNGGAALFLTYEYCDTRAIP